MKALIEQYLLSQNIVIETFNAEFLRYTTKIFKDEDGLYHVEFPKWHFNCDRPKFSSSEIEEALMDELKLAKIDGVENKYTDNESLKDLKIDAINLMTSLEEVENYEI